MANKPAPKKTRRHKETVPVRQANRSPGGARKQGNQKPIAGVERATD